MLDFGFYYMECVEGMKQFPDKYFDLAIPGPPYGRKEHGGKERSGLVLQKNGSKIYVKDGNYKNYGWDNEPPNKDYFDELMRVSKHQIIWGCNYFNYQFGTGRIIWDKCNDGSDQSSAEIAYNSTNDRVDIFRYMWRGMFQGKSIEEGWVQQGNKSLNEIRIHPTQKPVNLYRWILKRYANPEWKLLDTHVGSASSLIAFEEYGFNYVGFENNEQIYTSANQRLENYKAQLTLWDCGLGRT